jgi:hypothetical protein
MVSHHIFYQLVLLGLLWLFMMLHVMWPSDRPVLAPRPPQPVVPPRKRSKEPKPFAGLLHKPHCAACEQAAQAPEALPPPAPLPIISRRGRPREVDTSQHFCPHPTCAYRGWVGLGNLSIHVRRDSRSSIAYSEELISARMSATLQSTERHDGIVGQECCHFQLDL